MDDLVRLLEAGRVDVFIPLALLTALVWAMKQWRAAEKNKDELHEARLKDAKEMIVIVTEVKNVISALVIRDK